ncbi:MAG: hypothetical protein AAB401_22090 [Acidobacteriota bacterium]
MKRVANSYSARNNSVALRANATTFGERTSVGARVENWIPSIPNHAWLAMLALAFMALSLTVLFRAQGAEQEAVKSHAQTVAHAEDARTINKQLKAQTEKIKTDPTVKARKAQEQMRQVRSNEIVVARP